MIEEGREATSSQVFQNLKPILHRIVSLYEICAHNPKASAKSHLNIDCAQISPSCRYDFSRDRLFYCISASPLPKVLNSRGTSYDMLLVLLQHPGVQPPNNLGMNDLRVRHVTISSQAFCVSRKSDHKCAACHRSCLNSGSIGEAKADWRAHFLNYTLLKTKQNPKQKVSNMGTLQLLVVFTWFWCS